MPGVPDVYQGSELVDLSLVDPDNRRPVDYADRGDRLAACWTAGAARDLDDEKLLVTPRALRLRRDRPECSSGEDATYAAAAHDERARARLRPRRRRRRRRSSRWPPALAGLLADAGGCGDATVDAARRARWRDVLSDDEAVSTAATGRSLADLLAAPARSPCSCRQ